ncbi:phospholipase D-like domain-containing protein [Bacteroidota bacterium]
MKQKLILINSIFFICIHLSGFSQVISIAEARGKTEGSTVTINGIVTADEFGQLKYIQDASSGIAIYSSVTAGLKKGDSVSITGVTKNYNGELEIDPVNTYQFISNGNALPKPKLLTFPAGFQEIYEGQLVRFDEVSFSANGNFDGGTSGYNYEITQAAIVKEVRVLPQTSLVGTPIPSGKIDIIGVMGHYKNTYGTDKYQLKPRSTDDILLGNGPIINSVVSQSNIEAYSFTLSFETEKPGNTIFQYGLTKSLEMGKLSEASIVTNHSMDFSGLQPATFYYVKAMSEDASGDTSKSNIYYFSTASLSSGKMIAYFNREVDQSYASPTPAIYLNKSIDDTLVAYLNRATVSIDLAVYNLNNAGLSVNISTALNNAYSRGVAVRVIGDGSTANLGFTTLSGPKYIKSPTSAAYGIMHNKFAVIDAKVSNPYLPIVWTGSTNLTDGQIHVDANNVIIIQDQALAKAYTLEFEEMWGSSGLNPDGAKSKFASFKTDNTPHFFNVNGSLVELYFSPSDEVMAHINNSVRTSDYGIYFAVYTFTRLEMSSVMVDEHQAGSYVAGIFGETSGSNEPPFTSLVSACGANNIKAYSGSNIFHHKYCLVDPNVDFSDPLVITGSHNWSNAANQDNDENTLIIHNADIANQYFQEWAQRFQDEGGTVVGVEEKEERKLLQAVIANNTLLINMESELEEMVIISLFDLNGKVIMHRNYQINSHPTQLSIPLKSLNKGIYILQISGSNTTFKTKVLSH